jgi:hypothetical protein
MYRSLPFALLLLACACQKPQEERPIENATANQAAEAAVPAEVPVLDGDWKVATVDGNPSVGNLGMTASFAGGSATLATGCLKRAFTYTQDRNKVSFTTSPSGSANCGRAPGADEEAAYAALESSNIAIFAKDGKQATLSGTGGVLAIERR